MPVCSYVVFPREGRTGPLARTLAALDGCEVEVAENREMLLLVTATDSPEDDRTLRARVESEPDIECMVMAFGEIDPETEMRDPMAEARAAEKGGRSLPVLSGRRTAPGPASGSGSGRVLGGAANETDEES